VQYELFNGNPLTTGTQVPGTGEFELSAPATVSVTPEPATFAFAAGALGLLAVLRRRRSA